MAFTLYKSQEFIKPYRHILHINMHNIQYILLIFYYNNLRFDIKYNAF